MKRLILAALLLLAAPAAASQWKMDPARSEIRFGSEWNGQAVEGRFAKFQTNIRFDPDDLASAAVSAVIDLASATTGDKTVNASLPGDDWFAVKAAPTARFATTSISATGDGRYLARGTLELRGKKVPVELPFRLSIKGDEAVMEGTTRLDRRAFDIGMQSDARGSWVVFPVPVTVRVVARRAG
ncbi:MAG: YceI family protein [Sphingomonadaceae bacterium]